MDGAGPTSQFPLDNKMTIGQILRRSAISGSMAALTSGATAACMSSANGNSVFATLNAVTHCLWPRTAYKQQALSARYTLTGAAIHLGSGIFWGVFFEMFRGSRRNLTPVVTSAATTAVMAYMVDYHVVPERVTPGFEAHVPRRSFPVIYAALGLGLALATLIDRSK
jgi:hypothetical protein